MKSGDDWGRTIKEYRWLGCIKIDAKDEGLYKGRWAHFRGQCFVEKVLIQASEQIERRYRLKAEGWTLPKIAERVAEIFGIEKDQVVVAGKQPDRVRARSVLACWAIRDLGLTATEVGKYLGLSKSAVSGVATWGQKLIVE